MDESQKTTMRNYTVAAGFFIIAAEFIIRLIGSYFGLDYRDEIGPVMMGIIISIIVGLFIVSVILILLKKRSMLAAAFLMADVYFTYIYHAEGSTTTGSIIIGMFLMILAAVMIVSGEKNRIIIAIIPVLLGISLFFAPIFGTNVIFVVAVRTIIALLSLYFFFACICDRYTLPFANQLSTDSDTDFKTSGSILAYLLFGIIAAATAVSSISGGVLLSHELCVSLIEVCGFMITALGILIYVSEKVPLTSIFLILVGVTATISAYTTGAFVIGSGILFVSLGLFAVMQKEARIVPASIMISYGAACFVSFIAEVLSISDFLVCAIFMIPAVMTIYLCFGCVFRVKLPLL